MTPRIVTTVARTGDSDMTPYAVVLPMMLAGLPGGTTTSDHDTPTQPDEFVASIGMVFRLIPAGSFAMGSLTGQPDERPVHRVHVASFYMGVSEVTQRQYERVLGDNPSHTRGADLPVDNVTWHDADRFCRRLSEIDGVRYRLATEAEWEYAAIGGMPKREYVWGDQPVPLVEGVKYANVADDRYAAKYGEAFPEPQVFSGYDDGFAGVAPVRSFAPNGYGLYDMAGNVFEWCGDWYVEDYYRDAPPDNPRGPASGRGRCMRGGGWANPPRFLRLSGRFQNTPDYKSIGVGFRCVRELPR